MHNSSIFSLSNLNDLTLRNITYQIDSEDSKLAFIKSLLNNKLSLKEIKIFMNWFSFILVNDCGDSVYLADMLIWNQIIERHYTRTLGKFYI